MGRLRRGCLSTDPTPYSSPLGLPSLPDAPEVGPRRKEARIETASQVGCAPQSRDWPGSLATYHLGVGGLMRRISWEIIHRCFANKEVFLVFILFISQSCDPGVFRPLYV